MIYKPQRHERANSNEGFFVIAITEEINNALHTQNTTPVTDALLEALDTIWDMFLTIKYSH